MSKTIKLVSLSAAIALSLGLLSGCAGDKTKALNMAKDALHKAEVAQSCCDRMAERDTRMHEKAMFK